MRLSCGLTRFTPVMARIGNGLIRPGFIFAPQRQPQHLRDVVRPFNQLFFYLGIGIDHCYHAVFALALDLSGLTPTAILLPEEARFIQDDPQRVGTRLKTSPQTSRMGRLISILRLYF